jgi:methanogen homoaconitase large subunit
MATLSERILGAKAGTYVDRKVDRMYAQDGTGIQAKLVLDRLGGKGVKVPYRTYVIFDHNSPANTSEVATLQHELREFCKQQQVHFSDIGAGISHQYMAEGRVAPGEIIVGADSHSCTLGAFGAFSTGVGATDMAGIWALGETWFRVPESIGFHLHGHLPHAAEVKDLALWYVGKLGADGATYQALEFIGEGCAGLAMSERMTMSNMAVEAGAKTGLFYADSVTEKYMAEYGTLCKQQEPEDCSYICELDVVLDDMVPVLAVPHRVDSVVPVHTRADTELDQVFIGTCTNGRYEDLERASEIMKGESVSVRTIVAPASRRVYQQALRAGIIESLVEAGCTIIPPGCGPCLGNHQGVLGEGEVGLSTANRNFKNRMGIGASYFLSSVTTASVSALAGVVTDPMEAL